ncbi:MAG: hypothetical protein V7641_1043 [Blastocatellia bacterium]
MVMSELIAHIESALADITGRLWFPDLTEELVQTKWQELTCALDLTPSDYATSRILSANKNALREVVMYLPTMFDNGKAEPAIAIELLTGDALRRYKSEGIRFYSSEEIVKTSVLECIKAAFAILRCVPSLQRSVAALVRVLHIIKPENEDYDISFSEPHIPFSIFVSVPERRVRADALRVAEAIVHEAMHLQLTLLERVVPLVESARELYFSPWRDEHRTAQGILHALYVFRVIDSFLQELLPKEALPIESLDYIKGRCVQIAGQIHEINAFKGCSDLSVPGASLVRHLLA